MSAWRGSAQLGLPSGPPAEQGEPSRVLLLMGPGGNRRLMIEHLRELCTVVEPNDEGLVPQDVDLAIVGPAGLRAWREWLQEAKERAAPTFLPVMLVLPRSAFRQGARAHWDLIDEFVVAPIDRQEFSERVSMLLRARRLALAQRSHLAYLATHDRATGLPNQNLFLDRLADAVRDATVLNTTVHVAAVHLPLERVVKSLGHHGMETITEKVSARLAGLLEDRVSLARLTTETWGFFHRPGTPLEAVVALCSRLRKLASEAIEVAGERVYLTPRIGVAAYPHDGRDGPSTLDSATGALSEAQDSEPVFYSQEMQRRALRSIRTESRLHQAIANDEFELWFQPQIDLATGGTVAVESLVRWRLRTGELVPPGEFIGVAEATGLIREIDRWVLRTACATMNRWLRDGVPVQRVAVNVTVQDLKAPDFVAAVEEAVAGCGLTPAALELELTETALLEAGDDNLAKLNRLREAGFSVAADDFGQGYSSLAYLHALPISTLKIDREFVSDMLEDGTDAAIVEAIVWLAEKFGLHTIAEGVETEEQAQRLTKLGVDVAQGFLYGKPMPEEELRRWLRQRGGRASPCS